MRWRVAALAAIAAISTAACNSLVGGYSLEEYKTSTTLKAQVQGLVAKSGEPYSGHAAEVDATTVQMNAAYEYSRGLANNGDVAKAWQIMNDPRRDLYGGFVRDWKRKGKFLPGEVEDKGELIGEGFDAIICAEANKDHFTSCAAPPAPTARTAP